jgi:hypothetical protein
MPIRINLLAESQAIEELRRKDPAKRALWVAAICVGAVLVWSGKLWLNIWTESSTLSERISDSDSLSKQYNTVVANQKKLADADSKLEALASFSSNRFLYANMLDSLMHTADPDIQVTSLRTEQTFRTTPGTAASTSETGRPIPAKKGGATERLALYIEAKDSSKNPGDEEISRYIRALATSPYFEAQQITTNSIQMRITGNTEIDADTGKPFVPFILECIYPERVR